jgi:DNA-directed RNA polymerase alpha subunit/DNA-directed RNA polymerase subunit L
MNPSLSKISEEDDIYRFTLSGINVSFANALRRTILSSIPINVIHTDQYETNQCTIHVNTGRLHNEILKQRLSSIPIHMKDLDVLPGKYSLEIDVKNDGDTIEYITTEQFRIKNKTTGDYLTKNEVRKIFPPNPKTGYFIDFARLRPKISDSIPGERISLSSDFSIGTAQMNSMYNVVSNCSYANTPDLTKSASVWEDLEAKLRSEEATADEIAFQKENYRLLDAQRQYVEDSYDFIIKTVGIYENPELVKKACAILQNKLIDIIQAIDSDAMPIVNSETTMESCFDIVLENEDYTIGKVVEYMLYQKYYQGEKTLSFCGFKKFHPHNTDSIVRVAFEQKSDKNLVRQYLRDVCVDAQEVFKNIYKMF